VPQVRVFGPGKARTSSSRHPEQPGWVPPRSVFSDLGKHEPHPAVIPSNQAGCPRSVFSDLGEHDPSSSRHPEQPGRVPQVRVFGPGRARSLIQPSSRATRLGAPGPCFRTWESTIPHPAVIPSNQAGCPRSVFPDLGKHEPQKGILPQKQGSSRRHEASGTSRALTLRANEKSAFCGGIRSPYPSRHRALLGSVQERAVPFIDF
jgi:hypothetical protein